MATVGQAHSSTFAANRDDRKTADIVAARAKREQGSTPITSFAQAREVLRSTTMKQAGGGAEHFDTSNPDHAPVFFLDGPAHKKKRATIARYFTPKAIANRYHIIMEQVTAEQLGELRRTGKGRLDLMSFDLAVAVAADIVGLTVTDRKKMARRLAVSLSAAFYHQRNYLGRLYAVATKFFNSIDFFYNDVKPAIRDRRANPQDDVLSHLVKEGYSDKSILIECMTYAAAGMVTTREFIVMAAWHMFDNDALRERFLNGSEDDQFTILQEILRLEPIAAFLYRRAEADPTAPTGGKSDTGFYALCLRDANMDEAAVGACPHALDPDRATKVKANGSFLSFGDGAHFCPGSQVALHETRMFLDALFRVPGIRLDRAPDIGWSDMLQSYELRNAVVTCDRT
ncbi:cytochrome P450 [Sphingomonas cavernae]|uniref:Cytochrome P450 n=1 Tax=Sphingomonas cavernae TaxID=2320861 RepID=A0A418WMN5_9SPHN|nr:cytochrome P450 [Sphingomonas cavernae]RJF91269.1 cytochrome P450 [Sphingomonas cavernae]